jgi:hypothetical protein
MTPEEKMDFVREVPRSIARGQYRRGSSGGNRLLPRFVCRRRAGTTTRSPGSRWIATCLRCWR